MTSRPDISVIVPAHHEGRLANHTMASLFRGVRYAAAKGLIAEILVILDRADAKTRDFFNAPAFASVRKEAVDFGDLGLTRNFGIARCRAPLAAFLDADDLIGENWFHRAHAMIAGRRDEVVVHPEYAICFEAENLLWRQLSSTAPGFRAADLIENNHWVATCMAQTDTFRRFPYQPTTSVAGFGYEDWHFNCETLAAGIPHLVAPDTVFFLRKKRSGSLLAQTNHYRRVVRPSTFFKPDVFRRFAASRPSSEG